MGFFILIVVTLLILGFLVSYNRFIKLRQLIKNSFANIDTELQRRHDLIPNLVETVKTYAAYEQQVFDEVTEARANAIAASGTAPSEKSASETQLSGALKSLFAISERYPELKANENFLKLQHQLTDTEDRIQVARRFYNNNVRDLNIRVESFPSTIIASLFGFKQADYFDLDDSIRNSGPAPVNFDSSKEK